jgi:hypothetical protein
MPLYRVEEEGEEALKAVGGGARRGRRRSLLGLARSRAPVHDVQRGFDLRGAGY